MHSQKRRRSYPASDHPREAISKKEMKNGEGGKSPLEEKKKKTASLGSLGNNRVYV